MRKVNHIGLIRDDRLWFVLLIPIICLIFHGYAQAFTLHVQDSTGAPLTVGYRWLLEEDVTYPVDPNNPQPIDHTLALNFHKSYMPVIASGEESLQNPLVSLCRIPTSAISFPYSLFPGGSA